MASRYVLEPDAKGRALTGILGRHGLNIIGWQNHNANHTRSGHAVPSCSSGLPFGN
jgi:hypothetical protein